jgi:hypothetical protein
MLSFDTTHGLTDLLIDLEAAADRHSGPAVPTLLAVCGAYERVSPGCPGRADGSTACTFAQSRTNKRRCALVARAPWQ